MPLSGIRPPFRPPAKSAFPQPGMSVVSRQQQREPPMSRFSSLRARLVGTVFLAVAPAWLLAYLIVKKTGTDQDLPWTFLSGAIGLLALAAAWYGGEHFVLRQVRILFNAARQLALGDLSIRTGLEKERGELGELARTIDA